MIKSKLEFGSCRNRRWFSRIERFNFTVQYKKGSEMIEADALSRSAINNVELNKIPNQNITKEVLRIHNENSHRKNIYDKIKANGIDCTRNEVKNMLKECEICARVDPKIGKKAKYIQTARPGEIMGADMLEISARERIIVIIDYFSRMIFAKLVKTKEGSKILEFIKEVFKRFKFEKIKLDNGKEFNNNALKQWAKSNGVELEFTIPYFHQSNGRVERANRTIRNALRKTKGPLKIKLGKIIANYNNTTHRAIGLSPVEALKGENKSKIKEWVEKYSLDYARYNKKHEKFMINDKVLIKNEVRNGKMEQLYKTKGEIIKVLDNDVYVLNKEKGGKITRHSSQLRRLGRGMLDTSIYMLHK